MNLKALFFSTLISANALASDVDPLIYYINDKPQPKAEQPTQLPRLAPSVLQSIIEITRVLRGWNPESNQRAVAKTLATRINSMGLRDGLLAPTVALVDAAILAKRSDIASLLLPSISRLSPATAKNIISKLRISPLDIDSFDGRKAIDTLTREAIAMIDRRHGLNARESMLMPDLINDWRQIDPSGISAIIFGPGSYIHDAAMTDGFDPREAGPLTGLTMDDVRACYSRCIGPAKHGAAVGEKIGAKYGPAIGGVVGTASGTVAGTLAGVSIGTAVGPRAGEAIGGAIGWGRCASKVCSGGSDEPKTPASPPSDGGTESGGTQPPPANPAPAPAPAPEPKESDDPPTPPPSTPDSNDGNGGGGNCHPGDQDCNEMVNPDIVTDDDTDPPSDTGRMGSHFKPFGKQAPGWVIDSKAPFVNPLRDPMFGRFNPASSFRSKK
jgi:hypothetical protein